MKQLKLHTGRPKLMFKVGDQPQQKYLLPRLKCGDLENISKEYEDAKENNKREKQIG